MPPGTGASYGAATMANSYYQQFAELAKAFAALGQASADPDRLLLPMPAPVCPPPGTHCFWATSWTDARRQWEGGTQEAGGEPEAHPT